MLQIKTASDIASHLLEWLSPGRQETIDVSKNVVKRQPLCIVDEIQIGSTTVKNNMEFPEQLKIDLPYDPVISLLGKYPKEMKTGF